MERCLIHSSILTTRQWQIPTRPSGVPIQLADTRLTSFPSTQIACSVLFEILSVHVGDMTRRYLIVNKSFFLVRISKDSKMKQREVEKDISFENTFLPGANRVVVQDLWFRRSNYPQTRLICQGKSLSFVRIFPLIISAVGMSNDKSLGNTN